jgi:hypothetical protein
MQTKTFIQIMVLIAIGFVGVYFIAPKVKLQNNCAPIPVSASAESNN